MVPTSCTVRSIPQYFPSPSCTLRFSKNASVAVVLGLPAAASTQAHQIAGGASTDRSKQHCTCMCNACSRR